jgi:hypothetical protein
MNDGTSIGLLGIALWLVGVVFVGAGQLGTFDPPATKAAAPSVVTSGPRCTFAYPRGLNPRALARVTKKPKTCTDGDLQVTWGDCSLRYKA